MPKQREKVKSTPFSEFIRHGSVEEKQAFFSKGIEETVKVQRAMIEESKAYQ